MENVALLLGASIRAKVGSRSALSPLAALGANRTTCRRCKGAIPRRKPPHAAPPGGETAGENNSVGWLFQPVRQGYRAAQL